jgi:hypothetical protein
MYLMLFCGVFTGCRVAQSIEKIECIQHPIGNATISESFRLEIKAEDDKGCTRSSIHNVRLSKERYGISHYKISVSGAKRKGNSDIFKVDKTTPPTAYHEVKLVVELKKRPYIFDSIYYVVDYKGTIRRDFSTHRAEATGGAVNVSVKQIFDSSYYEYYKCGLYQVKIESKNSTELHYMSEQDSKLEIVSRGGPGGKGTSGANGRNGALLRSKRHGQDGEEGRRGGRGGTVTLYLDSSAKLKNEKRQHNCVAFSCSP